MRIRIFTAIAILSFPCFASNDHHREKEWGYEGSTGPSHWSEISRRYEMCAKGSRQSPVELKAIQPQNSSLIASYGEEAIDLYNNGHTVLQKIHEKESLTYQGTKYWLDSFHFHHPSEHTVNGKHFQGEAHFVHRSKKGELLVLGVLIDTPVKGNNPEFEKLLTYTPPEPGEEIIHHQKKIKLTQLIPLKSKFRTYAGSLTTPPCTEGVRWIVFNQHANVSKKVFDRFAKVYPHNNRPVQARRAK